MQKITIQLSEESIKAAIKELAKYKRELNKKTLKLIDLMLKHGEDYAINQVGHVDTGETLSSIRGYRDGDKGVVVAGGNAIWLEFGTGVRHNGPAGGSPHPKGTELGMTIGEYGKGQGANLGGWWYYDGDKVRHTYGIEANLFMWKTARELERVAPELAREVFGNG
ncbi:MAG: hypothetical protein WDA65_02920 [Christensenellales bacterium]